LKIQIASNLKFREIQETHYFEMSEIKENIK